MAFGNIYGYPQVGGSGGNLTATYVTYDDERAALPNSLPILPGPNITITIGTSSLIISAVTAGSAGGTVTAVSVGNLNPLFTSGVLNPTSTPAISFTLVNQACGTFFMGPSAGGNAAPTWRTPTGNDLSSAIQGGSNISVVNTGPNLTVNYALTATTISSNTTLTASSPNILYVDASGGTVNLTLPAASIATTRFTVKKIDSSANAVVLKRAGSDLLDLGTQFSLSLSMQALDVQNDNSTNWWVS